MKVCLGGKVEDLDKLHKKLEVISFKDLLEKNLIIPNYQRTYSWKRENVVRLLKDLEESYSKENEDRIRLGTLILFQNGDNEYEIIDGQQRMVTLFLISHILNMNQPLDGKISKVFSDIEFDEVGEQNIRANYREIKSYLDENEDFKRKLNKDFGDRIEFWVIEVKNLELAYQLFDSQNFRGLSLSGIDILKAYHLRACNYEKKAYEIIKKWESLEKSFERDFEKKNGLKEDEKITFEGRENRDLLSKCFSILYKIRKWSRLEKVEDYDVTSKKCRDSFLKEFKGVELNSQNYNYLNSFRSVNFSYKYQISETIINGENFFEYIFFYINEIEKLELKMKEKDIALEYGGYKRSGDSYIREMYEALLLQIWDRYNEETVEKLYKNLYKWSYILRLENTSIFYSTINNRVINEKLLLNINNFPFPPTSEELRVKFDISKKDEKHKNNYKEIIAVFQGGKENV